jgi:hypothetical protein
MAQVHQAVAVDSQGLAVPGGAGSGYDLCTSLRLFVCDNTCKARLCPLLARWRCSNPDACTVRSIAAARRSVLTHEIEVGGKRTFTIEAACSSGSTTRRRPLHQSCS